MCYVKNPKPIYAMGFKLLNKDENLIPVYFEPFVKENIDIYFAFKSKIKITLSLKVIAIKIG